MRKLGLTFAVVVALGVGAPGAATAADSATSAAPSAIQGAHSTAHTSGLSPKRKAARKKALRKCRTKRTSRARKACRRKVNRRYSRKPDRPAKPVVPAVVIDVADDYFSPDLVNIKKGDAILWIWNDLNHDPHNINLVTGPAGVVRSDFQSGVAPAVKFQYTRTFNVPGVYEFACSLHHNMKLRVVVS